MICPNCNYGAIFCKINNFLGFSRFIEATYNKLFLTNCKFECFINLSCDSCSSIRRNNFESNKEMTSKILIHWVSKLIKSMRIEKFYKHAELINTRSHRNSIFPRKHCNKLSYINCKNLKGSYMTSGLINLLVLNKSFPILSTSLNSKRTFFSAITNKSLGTIRHSKRIDNYFMCVLKHNFLNFKKLIIKTYP